MGDHSQSRHGISASNIGTGLAETIFGNIWDDWGCGKFLGCHEMFHALNVTGGVQQQILTRICIWERCAFLLNGRKSNPKSSRVQLLGPPKTVADDGFRRPVQRWPVKRNDIKVWQWAESSDTRPIPTDEPILGQPGRTRPSQVHRTGGGICVWVPNCTNLEVKQFQAQSITAVGCPGVAAAKAHLDAITQPGEKNYPWKPDNPTAVEQRFSAQNGSGFIDVPGGADPRTEWPEYDQGVLESVTVNEFFLLFLCCDKTLLWPIFWSVHTKIDYDCKTGNIKGYSGSIGNAQYLNDLGVDYAMLLLGKHSPEFCTL
jgi:hypothetical protein